MAKKKSRQKRSNQQHYQQLEIEHARQQARIAVLEHQNESAAGRFQLEPPVATRAAIDTGASRTQSQQVVVTVHSQSDRFPGTTEPQALQNASHTAFAAQPPAQVEFAFQQASNEQARPAPLQRGRDIWEDDRNMWSDPDSLRRTEVRLLRQDQRVRRNNAPCGRQIWLNDAHVGHCVHRHHPGLHCPDRATDAYMTHGEGSVVWTPLAMLTRYGKQLLRQEQHTIRRNAQCGREIRVYGCFVGNCLHHHHPGLHNEQQAINDYLARQART